MIIFVRYPFSDCKLYNSVFHEQALPCAFTTTQQPCHKRHNEGYKFSFWPNFKTCKQFTKSKQKHKKRYDSTFTYTLKAAPCDTIL